MPAEWAAQMIVNGLTAGRGRVLVGRDAKAADAMVRFFPALYPRLPVPYERLTFGR